jgi:IS5 family transposase
MGKNCYFGMKAHIAVDGHSGLVHPQVCTAANVHDLNVVEQLPHSKEKHVFADSGYRASRSAAAESSSDGRLP